MFPSTLEAELITKDITSYYCKINIHNFIGILDPSKIKLKSLIYSRL